MLYVSSIGAYVERCEWLRTGHCAPVQGRNRAGLTHLGLVSRRRTTSAEHPTWLEFDWDEYSRHAARHSRLGWDSGGFRFRRPRLRPTLSPRLQVRWDSDFPY